MSNIITIGGIGSGGGGSQSELKKISSLTEGTIVRIKEKGVETDYYLAQHDYQPSLNGSGRVLFVRKNLHSKRQWNSVDVNSYATSSINAWLNSEVKSFFDADVREAMGVTTFPYTPGNGDKTLSTFTASVFMLSLTELGLSSASSNVEGSALPIADRLKIAYLDGVASDQHTRTPHQADTRSLWWVSETGAASDGDGSLAIRGIRWGITLPNTATVLQEPNLDGSYTLSLGDDDPTQQIFDLTVVGGTTRPENPADNTVWVNTDVDLGLVYLTPNTPENPEVGDVWVSLTNKFDRTNGYFASSNTLRLNDNPYLEINAANISQWNGTVWEAKEDSAIYANGSWTYLALYLYNYGALNGDFNIVGKSTNGTSGNLTVNGVTLQYLDTYFQATNSTANNRQFAVQFQPMVDISNFNKLRVVGQVYGSQTIYAGCNSAEITTTVVSGICAMGNASYAVPSNAWYDFTLEADLSSWTGDVYASIGAVATVSLSGRAINIYQVVLTA